MKGRIPSEDLQQIPGSQKVKNRLSPLMQFALIAGPFMVMIDSSVVNVAIPVISKSFNSSISAVQWVTSAYLLSLGAFLVFSPYASKKFGPLRPYSFSLGAFTAFSLLCALSPSLNVLIFARIAQGASGALMVPLAMDILFGESEGTERISPLIGFVLFLAPAVGPSLGGALIQTFGWHAIFLINIPVGASAVSIVLTNKELKFHLMKVEQRFDYMGSVIFGAGIALLLYGSSEGTAVGWTSKFTLVSILLGILLTLAYIVWASRKQNPSVNLRIVKNPGRALSLVIGIIANTVLFSAIFLIPVFVELVRGASALSAGLVLLPQGITTGIGTVIGNEWSKRGDKRTIVITGMVVLTISTVPLAFITSSSSLLLLSLILCGRGIALGLTVQPLLYKIIGGLSLSDIPDGNALFNVAERISGAFGISILATFFESEEKYYTVSHRVSGLSQAGSLAFHETMLILIVLSSIGLIMTLFMKRD